MELWALSTMSTGAYNNATFLTILTFTCSTIGMVLSTIALVLLLLTALLYNEWRQNYKNQLLIQFMTARFFYTGVGYCYDIAHFFTDDKRYFTPISLHIFPMMYTEMALMSWMFVFSKQMYDCFVRVFVVTPSLRKVSSSAWLIPAALSILLCTCYNEQNEHDLIFFMIYLFLLKWPVLSANGILLVLVLKSILTTNKSKIENNRRIIIVMVVLIFTFSIQQSILDIYKLTYLIFNKDNNSKCTPVFFIFFNIITVYHCAFSILFWLFGNKRTRVLWGLSKENEIVRNNLEQASCTWM